MDVSQAVERRRSTRAFLPGPVPEAQVRDLMQRAARAPSGGNLQPWRVHALTGAPLQALLGQLREAGPDPSPGYAIYPEALWEPYRSRRFQGGEALYATIAVAREDKAGRLRQLARNSEFFGAPVGLFILIERKMGPPQWSDLGMYVQTLMLLAVDQGLATCPQEYWTLYASTVERFVGAPEDQMLFCGLALGFPDPSAPINGLQTSRAPFEEWGRLHGSADGEPRRREPLHGALDARSIFPSARRALW